jgi:hypothetical protein
MFGWGLQTRKGSRSKAVVFLISGQNSEDSISLIFPDVEELLFKKGAAWGGSRLFSSCGNLGEKSDS